MIRPSSFKIFLSLFAFAIISLSGMSISDAQEPKPKLSRTPATGALQAAAKASASFQSLRQNIDRKTLSVANMSEALDFDADAAIDYVSNDISYLPYPGSMRGEVGAMTTGSASALDQALLLGGLLSEIGLEVVMAFGALDKPEVDRLMLQALNVKAPEPAIDGKKLNADVSALKNQTAVTKDDGSTAEFSLRKQELIEHFASQTNYFAGDTFQSVREEVAKHYVWIRYRDKPSEPWVDVHPSFSGIDLPTPKVTHYTEIGVPEGRGHQFYFTLVLDISEGGRIRKETILTTDLQYISELAATQTTVTLAPVGMDPTKINERQDASFFVPLVDGKIVNGSRAFSSRGTLAPANAAFESKSGSMAVSTLDDLTGKLGGLGTKDNTSTAKHVTGLWMEANYISPLGKSVRRRPLLDLRHKVAGEALNVSDGLLRMVLDFNIGESNLARETDYQFAALSQQILHLPWQFAVAQGQAVMLDYNQETDLPTESDQSTWVAMAMLQSAFLPARFQGETVLPIKALVSSRRMTAKVSSEDDTSVLQNLVDLMFTDSVTLAPDGSGLAVNPRSGLALGVERSINESVLLLEPNVAIDRVLSASKFTTVETSKALDSLIKDKGFSSDIAQRLRDDMASSNFLMVVSENMSEAVWWAENSTTGEVLRMEWGGGATGTAYTVNLSEGTYTAISVSFLVYGLVGCLTDFISTSSKQDFAGCIAVNVGLFIVGGQSTKFLVQGVSSTQKFVIQASMEAWGLISGAVIGELSN